jgi:4-amino-4-deoxy-L-arabinose transferase-like glycosyltransferase
MSLRLFYRGLPYLACLLACAIINLFYFPPTLVFPDEQRFLASAIRLAATGEFWVGSDRAWEMPGTALFFTPAVWLFGPHAAIVPLRFAQSILVAVQCALVAFTARRIFGKAAAALIAASVTALYPFFLYYQGLLLSETLFNTLLLGGIAALYWWRERGMRIDATLVVASLCFTLATLTKATLTILPPLLIAATAWTAGESLRRVLTVLATASCLYAAFMSPWWIRNAILLDTFVPFTTGSAQNLYLGNNPHKLDAGIDWASNVEPNVVTRISALPNEMERQRAFGKVAMDYIKTNPGAFIDAAAKKFARFWNVIPNAREFNSGLYSIISAASFGPILLLALICAVRRWRQWRVIVPIYLLIAYFTLVHVITIASLRYRLPIEPILILLAAEPLGSLFERVRQSVTRPT